MTPVFEPLLFDTSPRSDILVESTGQAVWPIRNDREYATLRRFANAFNVPARETRGRPSSPLSGAELLVCLGSDFAEEARLYGHITKRAVRVIPELPQTQGDPVHVLMAPSNRITKDVIDKLYISSRWHVAPGIICSSTQRDLRLQVLTRAASTRNEALTTRRIADFYPDVPLNCISGNDREIVGGGADAETVRRILGGGASVLSIVAHSDGVDADFGPLILCPLSSQLQSATSSGPPACLVSQMCHRLDVPVAEAFKSERLLRPEVVSARILLLRICHGIFPYPSLVDPVWALSSRLSEGAAVGALVTSYGQLLTTVEDGEPLVEMLSQGVPIGRALAKFNRLSYVVRSGQQLVLLGDPRTSIGRGNAASASLSKRSHIRSGTAPRNTADRPGFRRFAIDLRALSFLRAYLHGQRVAHGTCSEVVAACTSVESFESSIWSGVAASVEESREHRAMRESVLNAAFRTGSRLSKYWDKYTDVIVAKSDGECCPTCGQQLMTTVVKLRLHGADHRRRRTCVRCGEIEDSPSRLPTLAIEQHGEVAIVRCSVVPNRHSLGVIIDPRYAPARAGFIWPRQSNGTPFSRFDLPQAACGPLYLAVVAISGFAIAMARTPLMYGSTISRIELCTL